MKVTIIPIVIGTVTKGLVQGPENIEMTGWVGTVQFAAILTSASILRRHLETWVDSLSLKLQSETII